MLENVQTYLSKQGVKYIKPEKAEPTPGKRWKTSRLWDKLLVREMQILSKSSRGAFGTP